MWSNNSHEKQSIQLYIISGAAKYLDGTPMENINPDAPLTATYLLYLEDKGIPNFNEITDPHWAFDSWTIVSGDIELHNPTSPTDAWFQINYQDSILLTNFVYRYRLDVFEQDHYILIEDVEGIEGLDWVRYAPDGNRYY
ncbi:MAG: hypothetical protein D6834_02315, partial [Aquificota bacterium]